jgi:flagellar protein FlbD
MIELNKLNGSKVVVNPDLIRFIEATPDTVLTFTDGEKMMVKNPSGEVIDKIIDFRRRCAIANSNLEARE